MQAPPRGLPEAGTRGAEKLMGLSPLCPPHLCGLWPQEGGTQPPLCSSCALLGTPAPAAAPSQPTAQHSHSWVPKGYLGVVTARLSFRRRTPLVGQQSSQALGTEEEAASQEQDAAEYEQGQHTQHSCLHRARPFRELWLHLRLVAANQPSGSGHRACLRSVHALVPAAQMCTGPSDVWEPSQQTNPDCIWEGPKGRIPASLPTPCRALRPFLDKGLLQCGLGPRLPGQEAYLSSCPKSTHTYECASGPCTQTAKPRNPVPKALLSPWQRKSKTAPFSEPGKDLPDPIPGAGWGAEQETGPARAIPISGLSASGQTSVWPGAPSGHWDRR